MPLLHFEAGDAFQAEYQMAPEKLLQVKAISALYLDAFASMHLTAYTIGDRDLALGIPMLQELRKKAAFPFLSANLLDAGGKPIFEPSIVKEVAGMKVAIIGAVTGLFVNREQRLREDNLQLKDVAEAVAAEVQRRKAEGAKLFILVGHLNDAEVQTVTKASPELQLVLGGQDISFQNRLTKAGGAHVAKAFMKGKNLGILDVHLKDGSLEFADRDAKKALASRKAEIERDIKTRERSIEQGKKTPGREGSMTYLEQNLVALKTELQTVTMDLEEAKDPSAASSYLRWELKPMDDKLPDEPGLAKAIAVYRKVYPDPTARPAAHAPVRGAETVAPRTVTPRTVPPRPAPPR